MNPGANESAFHPDESAFHSNENAFLSNESAFHFKGAMGVPFVAR
jgi:hypothetical protein